MKACKQTVYRRGANQISQCKRPATIGLYCWQHTERTKEATE